MYENKWKIQECDFGSVVNKKYMFPLKFKKTIKIYSKSIFVNVYNLTLKTRENYGILRDKYKYKKATKQRVEFFYGGAKEDRTPDLLNAIQALSQLSYNPTFSVKRLGRITEIFS